VSFVGARYFVIFRRKATSVFFIKFCFTNGEDFKKDIKLIFVAILFIFLNFYVIKIAFPLNE
jgi:hypothetical protein